MEACVQEDRDVIDLIREWKRGRAEQVRKKKVKAVASEAVSDTVNWDCELRVFTHCERTDAMPGTAEKIAVLAGRAARGESLWHEEDPVDWSIGRCSKSLRGEMNPSVPFVSELVGFE